MSSPLVGKQINRITGSVEDFNVNANEINLAQAVNALNLDSSKNSSYDSLSAQAAQNFYTSQNVENVDSFTVPIGVKKLPRSIANTYALFQYRGMYGALNEGSDTLISAYSDNVAGGQYRRLVGGTPAENPTVQQILQFFGDQAADKSGAGFDVLYEPQDFIFCKYYRKIPNNYLVTLRRFGSPAPDNIYSTSVRYQPQDSNGNSTTTGPAPAENFPVVKTTKPDIARAVTWMGDSAGNKLEDLLKFTYGFNYKDQTGTLQSHQNPQKQGNAEQSPFWDKLGGAGRTFYQTISGVNSATKWRNIIGSETGANDIDWLGTTYENYVLGPINVINKNTIRDTGLKFEQDIKLVFEYEMKSFNHINPKVAMLDMMANLLVLTYNNASFWGGAHRFYGSNGYSMPPFGDFSKLQRGDIGGFLTSVISNVTTRVRDSFMTKGKDGSFSLDPKKLVNQFLGFLNNVAGDFLGQFAMDNFGAGPGAVALPALVSGDPHGCWHVTIGNPLNPIAMIGNLHLDTSDLSFGPTLGRDDFPTSMKLEVTLKHAKPRDKTDFESIFNAGKGRLYASGYNEDILNARGKDFKDKRAGGSGDPPGQNQGGAGGTANTTTTGSSRRKTPSKGGISGSDHPSTILSNALRNPAGTIYQSGQNLSVQKLKNFGTDVGEVLNQIRFRIDS